MVVLHWKIFEVALTYLLEAAVSFFIALFYHCFIRKETKDSFLMSAFNFIAFSFPLYAILVLWAGTIYYLTGPNLNEIQFSLIDMKKRILDFELTWVLLSISIIQIIAFIIEKKQNLAFRQNSLWDNLEKIFYINAFIGIAAIVFGMLPYNSTVGLFLFIIAKILVDYFLEKSRNKLKKKGSSKQ